MITNPSIELPISNLREWPAPWPFSLLILPLGIVVVGFNFTALPLLLAQSGVPVDRIASISSISLLNQRGKPLKRARNCSALNVPDAVGVATL